MDAKQQQVVDQCKAVSYLATQLASVHTELATIYATNIPENILTRVGERTAALMEQLGDVLNGMDAVDEDDRWIDPIFERAHAMFPTAA